MSQAWPRVRLGHLLTRSDERTEIRPDRNYRQITVRLWGEGVVLRNEISGMKIRAKTRYTAREGQFILSRIDARNGAFGLVPDFLDGAVVSNDFPCFDIDQTKLIPEYLEWMSKTRDFVDLCRKASEGTTNRVRLQLDRFSRAEIPLPPLTEQRRIVARIEMLAAKVEAARALREAAEREAEALVGAELQEVFSDLRQRRDCQHTQLGDVAKLQRGRFSHRPRNDPAFFGGSHPWIQIGEVESAAKYITGYAETLNDAGLAISRKFPRGTLLISIAATIGAIGILDFDCCIPDSIVAVMPDDSRATSEFIYYYLAFVRSHLEEIAPQSAQKNINLKILNPLPISLPPLPEQHCIVTYLGDLQAKVDTIKQHQATTAARWTRSCPRSWTRRSRGSCDVNKERLEALLSEATVDCYSEDEAFVGVLYTLEEHLNFPLNAWALGEPVEVVGLNDHRSSPRRGIIARVCKGGKEYNVALAELEFVDPDPVSAEWLEVYRYWLRD